MPHITDVRFEALRTQLPLEPPTTNDLLFEWALTQGGNGNTLNDRIYTMLIFQGATPGHVNDMWAQVLALNGFGGSLNDQLLEFWQAGGSFSGSPLDNLLLDAGNLDEYLLEDGVPGDVYLLEGSPFVAAKSVSSIVQLQVQPNPEPISGLFRFDWFFRPDGTQAWTWRDGSSSATSFRQYNVSPAWSLAPGSWTAVTDKLLGGSLARTFEWNDDGTILTMLSRWFSSFRRLDSFDQSATPYDVTVLGAATGFTGFPGNEFNMHWKPGGLVIYISKLGGIIDAFSLTIPYDISTINLTPIQTFDSTVDAGSRSLNMAFSTDGTRWYSVTSAGLLCQWDCSTPFDVSTSGSFLTGVNVNLPTGIQIPRGLLVRPDTGDIYLEGDQGASNQRTKIFG